MPDQQVQALSQAEKVPIVYTNVALRNWQPFVKLGVSAVHAPGGYFSDFNLDQRVSIGEYSREHSANYGDSRGMRCDHARESVRC